MTIKEKVRYAVEVTTYEKQCLYKEWGTVHPWKENLEGHGQVVGSVGGRDVFVVVTWSCINGHQVAFVEATSTVIDHSVIEQWVVKNLLTADGVYEYAENFYRIINRISDNLLADTSNSK